MDLYNKSNSVEFYDDRYKQGYMENWPLKKKQRIIDIIHSMKLPVTGEALDFGCGNGVFTGVIKEALPQWKVYGVDISAVAIENAKKRYTDCNFFVLNEGSHTDKKFDFIFSHHFGSDFAG